MRLRWIIATTLTAALTTASPAAPLRILTAGDSLTAGIGGSDGLGYRRELSTRLNTAGLAHTYVGGAATGGWTVQDLAAGMPSWLATHNPDLVIIAIGTNNAAQPLMAAFEPTYIALVNSILAWSPSVRVAVTQVGYSNAPWAPAQVAVNEAVIHAAWWSAAPARTILLDWSGIHPCMLSDGVHPRDAGYDIAGRQVYRGLAGAYGLPALAYAELLTTRRPGIERPAVINCYP